LWQWQAATQINRGEARGETAGSHRRGSHGRRRLLEQGYQDGCHETPVSIGGIHSGSYGLDGCQAPAPVDNQQAQMKAAQSATNDENRSGSLSLPLREDGAIVLPGNELPVGYVNQDGTVR